jgi:hypothetical protein
VWPQCCFSLTVAMLARFAVSCRSFSSPNKNNSSASSTWQNVHSCVTFTRICTQKEPGIAPSSRSDRRSGQALVISSVRYGSSMMILHGRPTALLCSDPGQSRRMQSGQRLISSRQCRHQAAPHRHEYGVSLAHTKHVLLTELLPCSAHAPVLGA